ncbi:MAG: Abi family protein [Clostridiales bacterium]|nr:Abi family protein [Roseburia sp.]MDD7636505.1 Abi family protein [Clostridiales bacterium]MDY4111404.1 Abi family protein [Roseburia sp.]
MPVTKDFKTIEEQIAGLDGRGLKFKNRKKAADVLRKYNYFDVINGFEMILLKKNTAEKEYEGVYFEDFRDLYFFDMRLKKYTLFKIFDIESRLRTSIAYNFAEEYCKTPADTMNYTNPVYYKAPSSSDKHMSNIFSTFDLFRKTQLLPNGKIKKKSFIDELKNDRDYVGQYTEPPFWVVIKALPLGSLYYTFVFLDDTVKEKVLKDFGLELSDAALFEQALFVLKEVRNQCAHLELITRFRLKRKVSLNNLNDITVRAGLSHGKLNYLDVVKIFILFGNVSDIKKVIATFYLKMLVKGRKKISDKALAMMGRKKFSVWMKL